MKTEVILKEIEICVHLIYIKILIYFLLPLRSENISMEDDENYLQIQSEKDQVSLIGHLKSF